MIQPLSELSDGHTTGVGDEVTIRCRIQSEPMPGDTGGDKTVYHVDDPHGNLESEVLLSFWIDDPSDHDELEQTEPYVCSALDIPTPEELERGEYTPDSVSLQRGEELLVRVVPNRGQNGTLFLNVTSFVVRDPNSLISKSKLRTQERCPREYYLRYVKNVYPGDKFDTPPYQLAARFRGDAIHKITENALTDHRDRFRDDSWSPETIETFCEEQFSSEFGYRQALLVLSGAGLEAKEHVVEAVTQLFTDAEFLNRVQSATEIVAEQYLSNEYGYAGKVDILLDDVPYDIKTTRNPDDSKVRTDAYQVKLYLFALLLEQIDSGGSFRDTVDAGQEGYLIYPNTPDESVRFERVELDMEDVRDFLEARNDVVATGDSFAPPSTYNRECDGCAFAVDEWISGEDDVLPPACTYHCQNERRWPCYETDGGEMTTQCSLFDGCKQRNQYRDPEVIDHYETIRAAFQDEKTARRSAKRVVDNFDEEILVEAGYRVPNLTCAGARAAGTIVRFTSPETVIPAFEPGEIVELRSPEMGSQRAVYYGRENDEYLFSPLDESVDLSEFLTLDTAVAATYTFSVESIEDRYLPYLDFAQRRGNGDRVRSSGEQSTDVIPDSVSPGDVSAYLDREQLFVDLPVSTRRNEQLAALVRELATTAYPHPDGDGDVPDEGRRALILCATPQLAACASSALPDYNHYRLDGTGGPGTIQNDDGYHSIQTRLLDSRSLVSTVQQATSQDGPGNIREFFHRLTEGSFGNRDHSDNFFDVLVLLGAERLTEPEYYFLSDTADRIVSVGDVRRSGPLMLSPKATDANLDVFFEQEFERYRSFPTNQAASLQVKGEAPPGLQTFYQEGPWKPIDGDLTFVNIEGDEETAVESVQLEVSVPAETGSGRRLVFNVTDTPVTPIQAHELFENRIELDATALREQSIVVLDNQSLFLESKTPLEGENPTHHQVIIRAKSSELPQFSRALLSNGIAEKIVKEVVDAEDPDLVVTPFERHGSQIKRRLVDAEIDVPVRRPEELNGTIAENAVISLATSNTDNIVRPPLDDPSVLYSLLSSGQSLTLIGNEMTLRSKDVFGKLIDRAESYDK